MYIYIKDLFQVFKLLQLTSVALINEFEVKPKMFNVNLFVEVQFVLRLYKGSVVFVQVAAG